MIANFIQVPNLPPESPPPLIRVHRPHIVVQTDRKLVLGS